MAYSTNRFCWQGVISTDVKAAEAFYPEVLGWKVQRVPMGDGEATMFKVGDTPRLHLAPPAMDGVPSHWNNYLRVDDVDKATKAAVASGGKQLVAPTDIPPGRFSVVASPSGATFSLFHEADESADDATPGVGGIHWTELHSKALDKDLTWLKKTFGYTTEEMDMPHGKYYILKAGDAPAGGAMTSMSPEAPSMWLSWVHVKDVDATLTRVKNHGGKVHGDIMEIPTVGRMAVVADPTGGVFGIITPAA